MRFSVAHATTRTGATFVYEGEVLDTNLVSEPLRPRPSAGVMRHLRDHAGEMEIPALVWHELRFGCVRLPRSRRRAAIERYLEDVVSASFPILGYDTRAADWHAMERARLVAAGRTPSFVDGQIAAIARVNELILVTLNDVRLPGLQGRTGQKLDVQWAVDAVRCRPQ